MRFEHRCKRVSDSSHFISSHLLNTAATADMSRQGKNSDPEDTPSISLIELSQSTLTTADPPGGEPPAHDSTALTPHHGRVIHPPAGARVTGS